ncbi:MAG: YbgC/FadM family acyl-CoA thioesterase [Nitrospinae bacterium]|nr:YbgC/FadM family acyl-CoA thioesterase [Nitrospinota bacterium]
MEIRIYYEDTDCGGVVYYANYLRYFERARTEFMRDKGIDLAALMESGCLFTVSRVEMDYKSPAYYGDLLHISTEIGGITKASFSFSHRIERPRDGKLIVQGTAKLVCVNRGGRPTRLPEAIRKNL